MTRKAKSHLIDKRKQERLANQERELRAFEKEDLQNLLQSEHGRRFYYRLVFELCSLEEESFDWHGQDGAMARMEGIRWVGRQLRNEARDLFPDLWKMLVQERLATDQVIEAEKQRITQGEEE